VTTHLQGIHERDDLPQAIQIQQRQLVIQSFVFYWPGITGQVHRNCRMTTVWETHNQIGIWTSPHPDNFNLLTV
jgi:hypothetical protein